MIPKSGNRFSDKIMLKKKHDPEKWKPIFGQDRAQKKLRTREGRQGPSSGPTKRSGHGRIVRRRFLAASRRLAHGGAPVPHMKDKKACSRFIAKK
jgi:hypothetical protein